MDVRNCKECGRLFNYMGGPVICPVCMEKQEDLFQKVKEYIRDNPGATIQMISDANEVSTRQIERWVREERLELTPDSPIQLSCENCGKPIRTGRFCEACKAKMANTLNSAFAKPEKKPEGPKLRKRDRDDKMRFM